MTKPSIVFVAVLSLAAFGCKKNGADCSKAITNSMELSKADLAKMPGANEKMMAKLTDLGMQHCKDDKWSEDVVKCMSDAKTETEAQSCYGKMTPEQSAKMNKAAIEIMTPPGGSAAAGGSGAAATDTGAPGSGGAPDMGGSAGSATAPK
jgi:hypothetical protein